MNPIYCKYSNDRAEQFQIKTAIYQDENGQRTVQKSPLGPAAEKHVEDIHRHYLKMRESYEGTLFTPNKCKKTADGVQLEFVEGETFEQYLDSLYIQGRYLDIVEEIKRYKEILYGLPDNIPFRYTEEFDRIFGEKTLFTDAESLKVSNIDLIFGNVVMGETWTVIDYEWVMDFPVPVEFILYRAIHYYLYSSTKRNALISFQLFQLLGIPAEKLQTYAEMEHAFQRHVAGKKHTMAELKKEMLKLYVNARGMQPNRDMDFVQIYIDCGEGFSEETSVKKGYFYSKKEIELELELPKGVKKVRIDPAASAVIIKGLYVWGDNRQLECSKCNGLVLNGGTYIFGTEDPQIFVASVEDVKVLQVKFSVLELTEEWKKDVAALTGNYEKLEEELAGQVLLNSRLAAEKDQAQQYIDQLHSKRLWRIYEKVKKILRRR